MIHYTFSRDIPKSIINTIFYLFSCGHFLTVGAMTQKWYISTIFFLISAIILTYFIISEVCKKKIYIENNELILKVCFIKKSIKFSEIMWFSKNVPMGGGLFCKSKYNLCLFCKRKRIFISIKEQNYLEVELLKNKILEIQPQINSTWTSGTSIWCVDTWIAILFSISISILESENIGFNAGGIFITTIVVLSVIGKCVFYISENIKLEKKNPVSLKKAK